MAFPVRHLLTKLKLRYGSPATVLATWRGLGMRIADDARMYTLRIPSEPWLVRVGSRCAIAPDVTLITHNANTIFQHKYASLTGFGKIDIRENSYIGVNATVMPNVTIGPNSVVGAASVVTKDVPPESVVAGNPARVICTLDEYEAKCRDLHIDIPEDREGARLVLERHFWGGDA